MPMMNRAGGKAEGCGNPVPTGPGQFVFRWGNPAFPVVMDSKTPSEKVPRTAYHKRLWSKEEDETLTRLIHEIGPGNWAKIASKMPNRVAKQCRERWCNNLSPDIRRGGWTAKEEEKLLELHKKYGNQWAKIAAEINGRTDNAIKNQWARIQRRRQRSDSTGVPRLSSTPSPTPPCDVSLSGSCQAIPLQQPGHHLPFSSSNDPPSILPVSLPESSFFYPASDAHAPIVAITDFAGDEFDGQQQRQQQQQQPMQLQQELYQQRQQQQQQQQDVSFDSMLEGHPDVQQLSCGEDDISLTTVELESCDVEGIDTGLAGVFWDPAQGDLCISKEMAGALLHMAHTLNEEQLRQITAQLSILQETIPGTLLQRLESEDHGMG